MNNRPDNQEARNTVLEAKALAVGYGEGLVIPGLSLQIAMGKITQPSLKRSLKRTWSSFVTGV